MITLGYAGICGLLAVFLANQVLFARLRSQSEPDWRPNATERAQGNFVENVPLALLLLALLEQGGLPTVAVHGLGLSLVVFRLLHSYGMSRYPGANYPRLIGAQGTFALVSIMSLLAILGSLFAG